MRSIVLGDCGRPEITEVVHRLVGIAERVSFAREGRPEAHSVGPLTTRSARLDVPEIRDHSTLVSAYEDLLERIEREAGSSRRLIVWSLAGSSAGSDLAERKASYDTLYSMLVLTLPEVLFIPVRTMDDLVTGTRLAASGYDPTFDGLGDRSVLRQWCREFTGKEDEYSYLPDRKDVALAIDDEEAYALLHAYVAYRIGHRAIAVSSQAQADMFIEKGAPLPVGEVATLTLEDVSIRFADQQDMGLANLVNRQQRWPFPNAKTRLFVTSDHAGEHSSANTDYIDKLYQHPDPEQAVRAIKVPKPHAGMFRLWQTINWRKPVFVVGATRTSQLDNQHSSPGVMRLVAERMLDRLSGLAGSPPSMRGAVLGAVLATDALELLGQRTPTLAIEALRLKHQFEVMAECQFSGVEYHIPVRERLKELDGEVERICSWFGEGKKEEPRLNAMMSIATALVRELRRFGQFDEEQECMNVVRKCHFRLWVITHGVGPFVSLPLNYVRLLLSSIPAFVLSLALLFTLFCVFLFLFSTAGTFRCAAEGALITFFTAGRPEGFVESACNDIQAFPGYESSFGIGTALAIVLAYLHLAVFVAHLYASVNRR